MVTIVAFNFVQQFSYHFDVGREVDWYVFQELFHAFIQWFSGHDQ